MRRANPILTFSLCTALVVHLLGLSAMAWWYVRNNPGPYLPPINRWKVLAEIPAMANRLPRTPAVPIQPPPKHKAVTPPPPPPLPPPKPRTEDLPKPPLTPLLKDDSGEDDSHGTANRSTPGAKPMDALVGLEQADLMKALANDKLLIDPTAMNPASAGELNGSNDPRQVASSAGIKQPDFVAEADATKADADPSLPAGGPPVPDGPGNFAAPTRAATVDNHPAATGSAHPTPDAKPAATNDSQDPPKAVRGRLAIASDTDSAATNASGAFDFKAGKMVARTGLKVKFSQPRFRDASRTDMQSRVGPEAVFVVQVNADGTNKDVDVQQSSGSDFVDQDLKLCLYDSTFTPEKDKAGHPKRTVWTIHVFL